MDGLDLRRGSDGGDSGSIYISEFNDNVSSTKMAWNAKWKII